MEIKEKKNDQNEKGEVFYKAHPVAEPFTETASIKRDAAFVAEQIIWWVTGIVEVILLARMLIAAFGATGENAFSAFIYALSEPLVIPFYNLFGTSATVTSARFEFETLVAMVVYYLIAYIVVQLIDLFRGKEV